MVERFPNLKEEGGGSIPGYEIFYLLDRKTCHVVHFLLCFGPGLSTFCLKKKKEKKRKEMCMHDQDKTNEKKKVVKKLATLS